MAFSNLPISYCANVHPGQTTAEVRAGLVEYALPVRREVGKPIGLGLWMTQTAIEEWSYRPDLPQEIADWLRGAGLVAYTMNAFPFGDFHARSVKEQVYLPDWSSAERRNYTTRVADLLSRLLPAGADGSISTSPCAFKPLHPVGADWSIYFPRLIETAEHLAKLQSESGKTIRLAIEPEPLCVLETTDEAIQFFHNLWSHVSGSASEAAVREHLGLCFDVCHQAVEFENVADSIDRLEREGIRINKVHISCALELSTPTDRLARQELARYAEERYLHQTIARQADGKRLFVADLSKEHAIDPPKEWLEVPAWRVHFHVPVHADRLGKLSTTRPALVAALEKVRDLSYAPHLEIETYTWNVLPREKDSQFNLVAGLKDEIETTLELLEELSNDKKLKNSGGRQS